MERKLILFIFIFGLIGIIHSASEVNVDATKTYQKIGGFGGINHPDWIADLTEAQTAKAFKNGADDLGFSVLRVYVSDDSNAW